MTESGQERYVTAAAIEAALQHDVAGDPITGIRWTRRTTEKIATELATLDIQVCPRTVARILKDLDYRLRVNHKRVSAGSGPDRDQGSLGGRDVLPRRAVRETPTRPGGRWRPSGVG